MTSGKSNTEEYIDMLCSDDEQVRKLASMASRFRGRHSHLAKEAQDLLEAAEGLERAARNLHRKTEQSCEDPYAGIDVSAMGDPPGGARLCPNCGILMLRGSGPSGLGAFRWECLGCGKLE